jgi:hypothetical protein
MCCILTRHIKTNRRTSLVSHHKLEKKAVNNLGSICVIKVRQWTTLLRRMSHNPKDMNDTSEKIDGKGGDKEDNRRELSPETGTVLINTINCQ